MPTFDRQDRYAPEKAYSRIIWGKRSKVLEVELTEMQKILRAQTAALGTLLLTDGFITMPALTYTGGVLTLPASTFVIGGEAYSVQDSMSINAADGDTVYLAASEVEVSYTDTIKRDGNLSGGQDIANNGMLDPELGGLETSRRAQRQVQLVTSNTDPTKKYLAIGTVSGAAFTDTRVASRITDDVLPAIAITETYPVSSEAEMLALNAQIGDVAVRSDINKSFILRTAGADVLAHWQELLTPTDAVQSVAGKTGVVTLVKGDVGLGNVENYAIADQAEAEAGTASNKYMTPQRTGQAIAALSPVKSVAGKTGVVTLVKGDVGLGNLENYAVADQAEAEAGTASNKYMTPQRTGQAITALSPVKSVAGKTGDVTLAKADVGLGSVQNYQTANQAEAEAGTASNRYMTPQRTGQAIAALSPVKSVAGKTGDVTLAKADVGLGNVENYAIADQAEAEAGTSDTAYMTPLKTAQAIAALSPAPDASEVPLSSPNFTSTNVRDGMDELFQSVSDGKSLVAAAITDKGVPTAANATFQTMADNIDEITTDRTGLDWTLRTSAADNTWRSVTYGNGLFVAVASSGAGNRVMTSPDGVNWTIRSTPADNNWYSVCYGNGLFVAVAISGTGNRVMTSPDGINWTLRLTLADNNWYSVTYGNGLFVAVASSGTGNRVMTSPDGIIWTIRSTPADNAWRSVTYGNGLFVAVAISGTGNRVMTSPDGVNWVLRSTPADNFWASVCYGNGLFVAVSYSGTGNRVMTSPDGINWTLRTSAADNDWVSVTYGNSLFVAVANSSTGNRVMTSPDGVNWTIRSTPADNNWLSVTYGNGLFVAVAGNGTGNRVMTSGTLEDPTLASEFADRVVRPGINWTIRTSAADRVWRSVTYGNGLFVAVAGSGTLNRVMTSPDGINWTIRTGAASNDWRSVTYGNGLFVAVAGSGTGNRVMTSPDGINWTIRTSAADNFWYSVTYGNGLFVAVSGSGTSGNRVMTSPDGINWTLRSTPADNSWRSVTYGNGLFVAVAASGTGNRVMTSPDGINWTIRTSAADNDWYSVTYGNGLFVAVAGSGTGNRVMTSPDGINWTLRTSAADNYWYSVTYGNGLFVAVAQSGTGSRVMTSPDGINWTIRTSAAYNAWQSVTYGNGLFVAVASSGTESVMTSGVDR